MFLANPQTLKHVFLIPICSLVWYTNRSLPIMREHGMKWRQDFIKDRWSRFDSVSLKERSSLAILVWDQDNLHLIWLSQLRGFDSLEAIDWELNPYGTKKTEICRVYYCTTWNWIRSQWFCQNQSHENLFLSPTEHPEGLSLWLGPHPESNGEPWAGWS